jgi:hypothetical protein
MDLREELTEWGKIHNDDIHNPYSSQNAVAVIKSRIRRRRRALKNAIINLKQRRGNFMTG